MNGPTGEPEGAPSKPFALPTELWLSVFEHLVTYETPLLGEPTTYRKQTTRALQRLQYVCRSWRVSMSFF